MESFRAAKIQGQEIITTLERDPRGQITMRISIPGLLTHLKVAHLRGSHREQPGNLWSPAVA
jgi:hypothetical protein